MEFCKKHIIKVTGCSKWSGGDTREICLLCLSEIETKDKLYPPQKTLVKTHYKAHKTRSNILKTVPIFGEGGESR